MSKTINLNHNTRLEVFGSDEQSFMVTSSLIIKDDKALLVGAKFTQNDAQKIVSFIKENNLTLEKIFIIHGDPDYYFGLEAIKNAFPYALAVATQETVHHILDSLEGKLAVWKEGLGDQAPKNVVIPQIIEEKTLSFSGDVWELVGSNSARVSLWNKEDQVLIGGIDTFNEIHLFLADTKTITSQNEWKERIEELLELNPATIVPSHGDLEGSFDRKGLEFALDYLTASISALEKATKSEEFKKEILKDYPSIRNLGVLELSSKVVTNEIPWGE
ncbi:MBL fold metallo-hydrolase [Lactococcus lactis]|uniref:MBL fold metallo-hydrolase n=1 Tax=Lactococcus lactis TaxID=1358 RepID=UPI003D290027